MRILPRMVYEWQASIRECLLSLLNKFEFFKNAIPKRHYPRVNHAVRVQIYLIASPIIVLAWLKEELDKDRPFSGFNHLPLFSTSEMFFSSANSLVSDDNA